MGNLLWRNRGRYGNSCATDASGNIYLSGCTSSTSGIATTGAHLATFGGGDWDAFLVKFNSSVEYVNGERITEGRLVKQLITAPLMRVEMFISNRRGNNQPLELPQQGLTKLNRTFGRCLFSKIQFKWSTAMGNVLRRVRE